MKPGEEDTGGGNSCLPEGIGPKYPKGGNGISALVEAPPHALPEEPPSCESDGDKATFHLGLVGVSPKAPSTGSIPDNKQAVPDHPGGLTAGRGVVGQ